MFARRTKVRGPHDVRARVCSFERLESREMLSGSGWVARTANRFCPRRILEGKMATRRHRSPTPMASINSRRLPTVRPQTARDKPSPSSMPTTIRQSQAT